mgnify:CR=1 FL=1
MMAAARQSVTKRQFLRLKEALDRIFAAMGLLVLLPALAVICVIVKMTSRGPAFHRQQRVGQNGRLFSILKVRTMVENAECKTGPVWAQDNDPRVTRFGRFLRNTHLDEIPQLINVLKGDMSLVGPRPERPVFVEKFKRTIPGYEQRLMVKPGITGLAQVYHTYDSTIRDVRKKLAYDLLYIKRMCMMTDLLILFLTVRCLTGRGAK